MTDETKIMHLPEGSSPPRPTYDLKEIRSIRRREAIIVYLAAWNIVWWTLAIGYWITHWKEIFR